MHPVTQTAPDYLRGVEDGDDVLVPLAFDAANIGSPMRRLAVGNLSKLGAVSLAYNPGSIAANTVAADGAALAIAGVLLGDVVLAAIKPTVTAGLGVLGARVTSNGNITATFVNATAAPIDAGSETWTFVIARPDSALGAVPASFA